MINIQSLLKKSTVKMTLVNEAGEFKVLGEPETLRPTNTHYTMVFKTDGIYTNVSPFTMVVLHTGRKIHEIVEIKPAFMGEAKTVELLYS